MKRTETDDTEEDMEDIVNWFGPKVEATNYREESGSSGGELAEIYNDVAISLMARNIYILYGTWLECLTGPRPLALSRPSHLLDKLGCSEAGLCAHASPRKKRDEDGGEG